MSQKVVIVDDMTGQDGAVTRTFGLDAVAYSIDLTEESHARLRAVLEPFIARATRVRGGVVVPQVTRHTAAPRSFDPVQVRGWANAHGVEVPSRGRVPGAVVAQWEAWQEAQRVKRAETETETAAPAPAAQRGRATKVAAAPALAATA